MEEVFAFTLLKEVTNATSAPEQPKYTNRTDHCAYHFSDKSCPWPTIEEMQQIDIVCTALEIQMDTIFCLSLIFGLPGSVLVVATVASMALNPSTIYMKVLAVSDFISLVLGVQIFKMPNEGNFTIDDVRPMWLCRLFQAFSNWTLALVCLERFISVMFPLEKSKIFSIKNTKISVAVAFLVSSVPFVWSCIHYDIHEYGGHMVFHLNIMHNLIYSLVPGTMVVLFSALTALQLRKITNKRKNMTQKSSFRRNKLEAVLTKMMFVISISFVVINAPWGIIHIYDNVRILFCPFTEAVFSFFYYGCLSFTFVNHAINFYVYYAFAKGFRTQFKRVSQCAGKTYLFPKSRLSDRSKSQ